MGSAIVVAPLLYLDPTYCQISSPLYNSPSGLDYVALNSTRSCPGCSVTCRRLDWRRHTGGGTPRPGQAAALRGLDRRRHSASRSPGRGRMGHGTGRLVDIAAGIGTTITGLRYRPARAPWRTRSAIPHISKLWGLVMVVMVVICSNWPCSNGLNVVMEVMT